MANSYKKLKDDTWGVKTDREVKPGDVVEVVTKSGAVKKERIDRVLFKDGNGCVCTVRPKEKAQDAPQPQQHPNVCPHCKRPWP